MSNGSEKDNGDTFGAVARELSARSENIDQVYDYLKGALTELFASKAFEGYKFLDVDIEYEGDPREQWMLFFGATETSGNFVSKKVFEKFFSISCKPDGTITTHRSDEISKIALDKVILEDESIDSLHPEFTINALSSAAAAAKVITKICAADGDFSSRYEEYARQNPERITPPKYSPYNMNGAS